MGQEARCLARIGEQTVEVKALLESDELILRGEYRARLPFATLDTIEATDGHLTLQQASETIVLELGPAAERWAAKMRNPPTLLDKLGVKAGASVAVVDVTDQSLLAMLRTQANVCDSVGMHEPTFVYDLRGADFDVIFVQIESLTDLRLALPVLAESIAQTGAVWVIHPKRRPDLKDTDVMAIGKQVGLVDNKVARISDTHSALRFVIPKAKRQPVR